MSNKRKTTRNFCNFHQHHFLSLLHQPQKQCVCIKFLIKNRYTHKRNGKSRSVVGSSICWILCSLLVKTLFVNRSAAATLAGIAQSTSIPAGSSVVPSELADDANAAAKVLPIKPFLQDNSRVNKRSQHSTFSELEREVVERLIKEWAPVVWLAPEEKFMPLGVEEFLANVHAENKGNSFTPGMPLVDNSEKSFLVTNTDIDKLLENKTSFIYGRNPNIAPVPIYAVVTLCNHNQNVEVKQHSVQVAAPPSKLPIIEDGFPSKSLEITTPTRGPYIPITLGLQSDNKNLRRSSRLYPMFHKMKRSLPSVSNTSPVPPYHLVMGEALQGFAGDRTSTTDSLQSIEAEESEKVNNFIANLVDNVKFSIPFDENDNSLESGNMQQITGFTYTEGTIIPSFHVTYWLFYPYSQGKNMCTLSLGPFGRIPFPAVYGYCLGRKKDIGSHIGDWEHMTLYFTGSAEPEAMYVSAHDAGAYYAYNRLTGSFEFKRQETRKGILQRPNFPKTVTTFNDHPVLFAAKGSHGLWTAPGKHRFVKVARLYDINGFGTPWNTWKHVQITYENLKSYGRALIPSWLAFKGKWGNPKSKCHPLRRIGLNFCEFSDGPTGIPLKEPHFQCGTTFIH